MKKLIALMLILSMTMAMAACGADNSDKDDPEKAKNPAEETLAPETENDQESENKEELDENKDKNNEPDDKTAPGNKPSSGNKPSGNKPAPSPGNPPAPAQKAGDTMSLMEIVNAVESNVTNLPKTSPAVLSDEMFPYTAFTQPREGLSAVCADALIGSIAHSVVVLRAGDEKTAKAAAADIDANKDPNKWICVTAEKSAVIVHGKTILLVMSNAATVDTMTANFNALWK